MADLQHLAILKQGVEAWQEWRKKHPLLAPDLSMADLSGIHLSGADLSGVNLSGADLEGADLRRANFSWTDIAEGGFFEGANLSFAHLRGANLNGATLLSADLTGAQLNEADLEGSFLGGANLSVADLSGASLKGANLKGANLTQANLNRANLNGADLSRADLSGTYFGNADLSETNLNWTHLSGTNFSAANLTRCCVYAMCGWNIQLKDAIQSELIITDTPGPTITVDHLEVAQFVFFFLHHKTIREVIETITSRIVLIVGCFVDERKKVLDTLKGELRKRNYVPVVFHFEQVEKQNITETLSVLARLARFLLVDLTRAQRLSQELELIVPHLPTVPVQLLVQTSVEGDEIGEDFRSYPWVLKIHRYSNGDGLLGSTPENIIDLVERKAKELARR